jgi:hypothetical protein
MRCVPDWAEKTRRFDSNIRIRFGRHSRRESAAKWVANVKSTPPGEVRSDAELG